MKGKTVSVLIVTAALLVFAGASLWMFLKGHENDEAKEKTVFAMDAACTVKTWGTDPGDICDEITRLGETFDCHNASSELSKLNSSGSAELSADAQKLIEQSLALTKKHPETDISIGALIKLWDITGSSPKIPGDEQLGIAMKTCGYENITLTGSRCTLANGAQLDVGAVAKGYALDKAKQLLDEKKADCAVISMGSSSLMYGAKPDGKDFTVGVKDPDDKENLLLKFTCGECFVSTSGGYERFFVADGKKYIHIFDKTTGRPAETDLASVTVICDNGLKSDQLSTSIFIGGTKKLGEYFADKSIQIIAVDTNGDIHVSRSLENKITLEKSGHKIIVEK